MLGIRTDIDLTKMEFIGKSSHMDYFDDWNYLWSVKISNKLGIEFYDLYRLDLGMRHSGYYEIDMVIVQEPEEANMIVHPDEVFYFTEITIRMRLYIRAKQER